MDFGQFHISRVCQQGCQSEERAQKALPFGNPCDRLNVERMPGEQSSGKCARPQRIGQSKEQNKHQNGIGRVKQHIDEMMSAGYEAEYLTISHVRKPRERMPVAHVEGGESPMNSTPSQAALDDPVLGHTFRIVENTETVLARRQEDHTDRKSV